jgi:formamidopyrimidine-DNA glycosylase
MPELAEVEFIRKRWDAGLGHAVERVELHARAAVFRGADAGAIAKHLTGTKLQSSATAAKQMLFRFSDDNWLGIHLGMTGDLSAEAENYIPKKHDHLVLRQKGRALVFSDPRMFGRIQFSHGPAAPEWWTSIAPAILSDAFTVKAVADFLQRRKRAPIKAVLLMQERFPGIGNWMADEILWRAAIHPKQPAGSLTPPEIRRLHKECRWVCKAALDTIGRTFEHPPKTWLFRHRWENGGRDPKTKTPLERAEIGGRTTCWSPARQKLHA